MIQCLFADATGLHIRLYQRTITTDGILWLIILLMLRTGFGPIFVPIHLATDRFDCLKKGLVLKEHVIIDDVQRSPAAEAFKAIALGIPFKAGRFLIMEGA